MDTSGDTTPWRKARGSAGNSGCLEFRRHQGRIQLRDSKLGERSAILTFDRREIEYFLTGSANGEFADLLIGMD